MARASRHAFTLIEILVVLVILLVLAALLFPMAQQLIARANGPKCLSNLRQISVASASYSADNNGAWPPSAVGTVFSQFLIPYFARVPGTKDGGFMQSPLICPSARTEKTNSAYIYRGIYTPTSYDTARGKYGLSYGQNAFAQGPSSSTRVANRMVVENPSKMMLYMDIHEHYLATVGGIIDAERKEILLKRHDGNINAAYVDGSVRTLRYKDIPTNAIPARMFWSGRGLAE
jgi:prepilin-type N-terminal cleavage/methylation domain-containing protein/prepilin-type processing-associated H-X9-DG protein